MKNIIVADDDDVNTSLKYERWLEDEGFNLTFIHDPLLAEVNLNQLIMI